MYDDMFSTILTIVVVTILAMFGIAHLVMDFRHFDIIEKQCKEQGYIQNRTVRIKCQKEILRAPKDDGVNNQVSN